MRSNRLNIYLDHDLAVALEQFCRHRRIGKSAAVVAALREYLSPDSADVREAALTRRLDRLSHQAEKIDHDLMILTEATAIYIRYYLSVVAPIPEAHQDAARAQGKARFQQFIDQLARHLQRGGSLVRDLHDELHPDPDTYAHAAAQDAPGNDHRDSQP